MMSGPFPGMDPYLEDPAFWPGVHDALIIYMAEEVNKNLPSGYVASIGQRVYLVQPDRSIYPDAMVLRHSVEQPRPQEGRGTGVAVAEDVPAVLMVEPDEIREVFVEIQSLKEQERIVTIIEVLSHANKAVGSVGRAQYLNKQREVLESRTHLLEIDLLRRGMHTLAPPRDDIRRELGRWDYLISLHRSTRPWQYELWLNSARQRLPRIRVPLAGDEPDVILDVQALLDHCYDAGLYSRRVDYRSEPDAPLEGEDAAWAGALLREKGLRT